ASHVRPATSDDRPPLFSLPLPRPPPAPLFPYTTLFRSLVAEIVDAAGRRRGELVAERVIEPLAVEIALVARHPFVQPHMRCDDRSEEHTSELQSPCNLVCRLLLEKKKKQYTLYTMTRRH